LETKVAVVAIIARGNDKSGEINSVLHEYSEYIIGRMGIPYEKKGVNIICIAVDAPQDKINSLAGKIGRIDSVTAKTVY
jgi:putative iron-only hydrogenase system regulator